MVIKVKWNWIVAVGVTCTCMSVYFLYSTWGTFSISPKKGKESIQSFKYDIWPPFYHKASTVSQTWFQKRCVGKEVTFSLPHLGSILTKWQASSDPECRSLLKRFETMYSFDTRHASLILPTPFQGKVKKWLGNNEDLYQELFDQEVIHVVNKFTREHTIFNPLRDKRPVSPPDLSESQYFESVLKETKTSCDFCNYQDFTAEHTFHRVESKYSFSASNAFKMDTLHALFALKQHDPLQWSEEQYMDLMNLTVTWFQKAATYMEGVRYPVVIWDVLPKCGASQVHPHLHGFLDQQRYHGVVEAWRMAAQDYYSQTGTNFYADMANVALALGLGISHKSAVAFASIVPRKDDEIVVMAPTAGKDFFQLVYIVIRALVDDLGKFCFSMGIGYPSLEGTEGKIPAYARIITRGAVTELRADISSLELFAATNVNVDPYKVIQLVKDSKEKRSSLLKW